MMKRTLITSVSALAAWLIFALPGSTQVYIRAPFVRVQTGDGVYIRAPFVNLYVPPDGPVYGPRIVTPPPVIVVPSTSQPLPAPTIVQPLPQPAPAVVQPAPQPAAPAIVTPAPIPVPVIPSQTLEAFAKSFQAKAGTYNATILNPVTNQPTSVRFTLPEGQPRRVIVTRHSIEWVYALRTWVRIEFDRDGVVVTAR